MITETDTMINRTDSTTTTFGMKKRTRLGFWNVRTLSDDSKLAQAEMYLLSYKLLLLGMTEVRRNEFGETKAPRGSTLLYSGKENANDVHEYGVGMLLSSEAKRTLLDWKPVSERIMVARFNSRARKITIVLCYAPTDTSDFQLKEDFYSQLTKTMTEIKRQDIVILMGDLNAKVGSDNKDFERVMGKHGLGVRSENGQLFLEFCQNHDLVIGGTLFPHKECHKYSWTSPSGRTRNQIDHVAITSKWRGSLLDVRNRRGADIDSDHELMVAQIRLRLSAPQTRTSGDKSGKSYDVAKLRCADILEKFRVSLRNRFASLEATDTNINMDWSIMKKVYTDTSSEIIGHKHHSREDWMSQETWQLIIERRELKLQLIASSNTPDYDNIRLQYRIMRKRIYRSCRKDRRRWADNIADRAETAAKHGNLRELYRATKMLTGRSQRKRHPLKDRNNQFITTSEGQLRRWKEHFTEVFSESLAANNNPSITHTHSSEVLDICIDPPTHAEVAKTIIGLRDSKAPGADLISAEMLKADLPTATEILTPLIQKIWQEELVPDEWRTGLLVTVPKKGNLSNCNNWRGITLLSTPSKVLSKILLDRISKVVEPLIRREQAGFRPGRSCTDQINTLRIILEQGAEFQREIYSLFVDFEKAFDTLRWDSIWSRLSAIGVPTKIINMIKAVYHNYACRVRHDGLLSDKIPVHAGVRQGCLLSPLLFLIVLDGVIVRVNTVQNRGIEWGLTDYLQDLDYADDLCLLSHRRVDMQKKLDNLQKEAAGVGLKINVRKTKDMRSGARDLNPLVIGDDLVERVESFTYLGCVVSAAGGADLDVASRIAKAKGAFACLRPVWQSKHLSHRVKLRIFNTCVKTVLLYGCETWKATKQLTHQLQVFINRCLRQIIQIFWPDTIANIDLWRQCHEDPVDVQIRRRKWSWIGHTLRRSPDHIPRQALDWNPQGRRKVGRPKQTWRRSVIAEAKSIGKSWSEVKRTAQDRTEWRRVVSALCPATGT